MKKTVCLVTLAIVLCHVSYQQAYYANFNKRNSFATQSSSLEDLKKRYSPENIAKLDIKDKKTVAQILTDDNEISLQLQTLNFNRFQPGQRSTFDRLTGQQKEDDTISAYRSIQDALRKAFDVQALKAQHPDIAESLMPLPAMS